MPSSHLDLKNRGGEVAIIATLQTCVSFRLLLGLGGDWGQGLEGREGYGAVLKVEAAEVQHWILKVNSGVKLSFIISDAGT